MKKTIWTFGLIAGAINALWLICFTLMGSDHIDFERGEILGYAAMILSFSLVFVAIKTYRDKYLGGTITFGQAFKAGILVTLIASAVYVIVWLFEYYFFIPDFAEKYAAHMVEKMRNSGTPEAEVQAQLEKMKEFQTMYRNPFFNMAITFTEIFPVGLVLTLISSVVLRRQAKTVNS